MERTYLYGIIASVDQVHIDVAAIDGFGAIRTIHKEQLGAIVADYTGEDFDSLAKEKLVKSLLAHQRVVEAVMQRNSVLPVKFGTLLHGNTEVFNVLSQGYSDFVSALASTKDKVELEVAATWDTRSVLQEISQDKEIVQFKGTVKDREAPTFEERVHLGQLVKARLDKRRELYQEQVVRSLERLSLHSASHELVTEDMVVNTAFLVERTKQAQFLEIVRQIDGDFADRLHFRVIGPLPPYSFCSVEIERITSVQIKEARQSLHLGEVFGEDEIRKAYRRLAASEYRSLSRGETLAKDRFAHLRWASTTLLRCCRKQTNGVEMQRQSESGEGYHLVVVMKGAGFGELESTRLAEPAGV